MGVILSNRLALVFGVIITVMFLRIDYKTDELGSRVDQLEDAIVRTSHRVDYTRADIDCLAKNIYYEAATESRTGKYAVGTVTVNRLKTGRWGNSVCKVVYSPSQFSWTLLKKLRKPDPTVYDECRDIAVSVLHGDRVKGLQRSLLYHADYIKAPKWADPDHKIGQIGAHVFYTKGKGSTISI